jgi:hypothetical protein
VQGEDAGKDGLDEQSCAEEPGGLDAIGDGACEWSGKRGDRLSEQQQADGCRGSQCLLEMQDQRRRGHGVAQWADGLGSEQPGVARRAPY